jgi:predicted nucleotidyltransferase
VAEARIALGAEIDIASGKEVSSAFDALRADMKGFGGKPKRIMRPLSQAVSGLALNTGGVTQLIVGRPAAGRVWVVTRVTVLGDDDHTVKANVVAALYIGDDSNVGLAQCVRHGTAVPFTTTENEHGYVVHDRETLFLNITATADGISGMVSANVLVWEYRDSDIDSQVI